MASSVGSGLKQRSCKGVITIYLYYSMLITIIMNENKMVSKRDHRKPRKILAHPLVDMNREQTIRLIQRYGEQRLLWDKKDPKHLNIEHRRESWTRIANEYKWPIGVLKKKIASLLGSHRRELHRERKSRIRAATTGTKYIYSSKWFGYPYFDFLRKNRSIKQVTIRQPEPMDDQLSDETADEDSDASVTEVQETDPVDQGDHVAIMSPPQPTRSKREISPEPTQEDTESEYEEENPPLTQSLGFLRNASNDANDSYVIFGNYIASELRKYDPRTLACVKHAIHNVIFEADLGNIQANTSDHSTHQPSQSSSSFVTEKISKFSPAPSEASNS